MARNPFGLPVADDAHRELSMLTGGDRAEHIMGNLSDRMPLDENVSGEGGESKLVSMLDDWMTKEGYDISDDEPEQGSESAGDPEPSNLAEDVPWDDEDPLEESRGMGSYSNVTPGVEPYFHRPKHREPRKPGLMGSKHEAALKKGYVDFGLIDVRNAKSLSDYKVAECVVAAMKNGVSFIRDPEGILANVLRWPVNDLGNKIKWEIAGEYEEQGSYASEGEDWDEEEKLGKAAKMANAATVSIKPVKGKTGAGYKVVMKPSQEQIDRKCFPQKRR